MIYLKAYHAYQKQNYDLALKLLQETKQSDIKKLDLLAQIYLQKKDYQRAYNTYQELLGVEDEHAKERKENILALIVCAQLERPGTLKIKGLDKLPTPEEIIDQVELINLKDKTVQDIAISSEPTKRKKRQKKRRLRLPKQYDPVAGPDPERWLPRRDRTRNAHKQKRRRPRPNQKGGKGRIK